MPELGPGAGCDEAEKPVDRDAYDHCLLVPCPSRLYGESLIRPCSRLLWYRERAVAGGKTHRMRSNGRRRGSSDFR